jgi:leader peptidase (prepilin peptidase)/N-methyltransferase
MSDKTFRLTVLYALVLAALFGAGWALDIPADGPWLVAVLLGAFLVALTAFDIEWMRLPDVLTFPLIAIGLLKAGVWEGQWLSGWAGTVIGYSFIYLVAWIWRRSGRGEAIGMGDAKLLAAAGAWFGPLALAPVLLVASLSGLLIAFVSGAYKAEASISAKIPFGPFIGIGMWAAWLAPDLFRVI